MSDQSQGYGWWYATDGKWYPPEMHPDYRPPQTQAPQGPMVNAAAPPVGTPTAPGVSAGSVPPGRNWPNAGYPPVASGPVSYRTAPQPKGMSAGKIVAIVLSIIVAILGALFLLGVLLGVGVFATQNLTNDASVSSCKVERDTVATANAAAAATSDPTDAVTDYLNSDLNYFQLDGQRLPSSLSEVSAADCPAVGAP